jgi:hypothetical protein
MIAICSRGGRNSPRRLRLSSGDCSRAGGLLRGQRAGDPRARRPAGPGPGRRFGLAPPVSGDRHLGPVMCLCSFRVSRLRCTVASGRAGPWCAACSLGVWHTLRTVTVSVQPLTLSWKGGGAGLPGPAAVGTGGTILVPWSNSLRNWPRSPGWWRSPSGGRERRTRQWRVRTGISGSTTAAASTQRTSSRSAGRAGSSLRASGAASSTVGPG